MTQTKQSPWEFQGENYIGPGQMGECPFEFTGNAHEDWQQFFKAAWQFAHWANKHGGVDEGHWHETGGKNGGEERSNVVFTVLGLDTHGDGTADGITIKLRGGWHADLYGHFTELMAMLPWGWPDGDLTFTNQPGDDEIILHLWHD